MTPEQQIFQRLVSAYPSTTVWTGSYAHGLFDAYVLFTGEDPDDVLERLGEAVNEEHQRAHDEMLGATELWERP